MATTLRWEEKRRVKVSCPVRERRRTRRRPSPTGARIDLKIQASKIFGNRTKEKACFSQKDYTEYIKLPLSDRGKHSKL